jgi:AcrR family transcriptional regulator
MNPMPAPPAPDRRRERSRRTRTRIVDAATRLFVDHGYLATTIEAVAERAGVAVQTVYYVFGTKRTLLAAVLDASIAGDADPIAVLERPWFASLGSEPDAATAIGHLVEVAVAIIDRAAPAYEVVRRAAADPDVGELLERNRAGRRADQRGLVERLAAGGHLRPGLDVDTAADVVYALVNEEVFQMLTVDCGWSVDRFRSWATELVGQQLT